MSLSFLVFKHFILSIISNIKILNFSFSFPIYPLQNEVLDLRRIFNLKTFLKNINKEIWAILYYKKTIDKNYNMIDFYQISFYMMLICIWYCKIYRVLIYFFYFFGISTLKIKTIKKIGTKILIL